MDRFGKAAMVLLPLFAVLRVIYDVTHPETWDGDWHRDPRRYWPIYLPLFLFCLMLAVYAWRESRKYVREQTKTAMLKFVLDEARKSQEEGNWDEAEQWLRCYENILKYGPNWSNKNMKKR